MTIRMDTLRSKITLKIIIVGDQGVGKTCLLKRFVKKEFSVSEKATIGADFMTERIKVRGYNVILQIWDTAGLERFSTLNKSFYRGADGVIIVYDVTVKTSYDNILSWKDKFLEINGDFALKNFTFCANKIDSDERNIIEDYTNVEIENCKKRGLEFIRTSAKSGKNVNKLFTVVAEKSVEKYMNENVYDAEIGEIFKDEVNSSVLLPPEKRTSEHQESIFNKVCGGCQ